MKSPIKSILLYILGSILFILTVSPVFAQDKTAGYDMNLNEFIKEALKNNHNLKSQKHGVEVREKDLDIARGERFGKISFDMSYKNYDEVTAVGNSVSGDYVKDDEEYSGVVSLEIPLYKGGSLIMNQKAASAALESGKLDFSWEKDKLIYDVAQTYYQILETEKLIKTNNEHLNELIEEKRIVNEYIHVGKAIKIDGLKVDVEILTTEQEIESLKSDLKSSYLFLFHLTGMPPESAVTVREVDEGDFKDYKLEDISAKALINRKDYLSLEKEKSQMKYMTEVYKGKMKPEVNLIANYTVEGDSDLETFNDWNAGVQFKYYFFQGGTALSKVKQARIEEDMLNEKIKELKSRINLEVCEAYFDMKTALVNLKRAKKSISYAEENLRIEKIKYEAEKNRIIDIIDAQNLLLDVKTDYYEAVYQYKMAALEMRKASGDIEYILKGDSI